MIGAATVPIAVNATALQVLHRIRDAEIYLRAAMSAAPSMWSPTSP